MMGNTDQPEAALRDSGRRYGSWISQAKNALRSVTCTCAAGHQKHPPLRLIVEPNVTHLAISSALAISALLAGGRQALGFLPPGEYQAPRSAGHRAASMGRSSSLPLVETLFPASSLLVALISLGTEVSLSDCPHEANGRR